MSRCKPSDGRSWHPPYSAAAAFFFFRRLADAHIVRARLAHGSMHGRLTASWALVGLGHVVRTRAYVMLRLDADKIDRDAALVVRRLAKAGFTAYLVGGCVRDLLLGRTPKDFDIATSATPNQVRDTFRNSRIIGRRFRLATVFFGAKIIETATFRANPREDDEERDELIIHRDNVFGSEEEDARRRDFTVNGLFYDLETERVIDHVHGARDLQARVVRTIGDPNIRFREDPVRMLRAIKFAARLGFAIERNTYNALLAHRDEIQKSSRARVLEEIYRLMRGGAAEASFALLAETGMLTALSPHLATLVSSAGEGHVPDDAALDEEERTWHRVWTGRAVEARAENAELAECRDEAWSMFAKFDQLIAAGTELSGPVCLAALAAPYVLRTRAVAQGGREARQSDLNARMLSALRPLGFELGLPRRDAERIRQLLMAQRRVGHALAKGTIPDLLGGGDFVEEAMLLHQLCSAGGELLDLPTEAARKKRRRRRGGRARSPALGDD